MSEQVQMDADHVVTIVIAAAFLIAFTVLVRACTAQDVACRRIYKAKGISIEQARAAYDMCMDSQTSR